MTIGILGAYGDVGAAATRQLLAFGPSPLRLGGRRAGELERFVEALGSARVEGRVTDFRDEASLRRFVEGCRVVLNCAGPARELGDRAARAALESGAHYVDAAGDERSLRGLSPEARGEGWVAVLAAGLQPGLSALLPRWLALREFDRVSRLISYFGLLDQFTITAADDYLDAARNGATRSLGAWRAGPRSGVSVRRQDAEVPFFPSPATLLPYLDAEGERLSAALGLARADWCTVVSGPHTLTALDRAVHLDRAGAVVELCRASELDLAGRDAFVTLLLQLDGEKDGVTRTRTLLARGRRSAELTGALAALATRAVSAGELPAGCHWAADVLEPLASVGRLRETGALACLEVFEASIEELGVARGGVL